MNMQEYEFVEDDEPVIEIKKIGAVEIENDATFFDQEENIVSINKDTQRKTFHCKHCGKDFSRYYDWCRHYIATHFMPTKDEDQDLIRAAGKAE